MAIQAGYFDTVKVSWVTALVHLLLGLSLGHLVRLWAHAVNHIDDAYTLSARCPRADLLPVLITYGDGGEDGRGAFGRPGQHRRTASRAQPRRRRSSWSLLALPYTLACRRHSPPFANLAQNLVGRLGEGEHGVP